jgi:hypothetical protein
LVIAGDDEKVIPFFFGIRAGIAKSRRGQSEQELMNISIIMLFAFLMLSSTFRADVGKIVGPLSCGIYDQMVKSLHPGIA